MTARPARQKPHSRRTDCGPSCWRAGRWWIRKTRWECDLLQKKVNLRCGGRRMTRLLSAESSTKRNASRVSSPHPLAVQPALPHQLLPPRLDTSLNPTFAYTPSWLPPLPPPSSESQSSNRQKSSRARVRFEQRFEGRRGRRSAGNVLEGYCGGPKIVQQSSRTGARAGSTQENAVRKLTLFCRDDAPAPAAEAPSTPAAGGAAGGISDPDEAVIESK